MKYSEFLKLSWEFGKAYRQARTQEERAMLEQQWKEIEADHNRQMLEEAEEMTKRLVLAMLPVAPAARAAPKPSPAGAAASAARKARKATPAQLKGLALKRMAERTKAMEKQAQATKYASTISGAVGALGSISTIYHGTTELIGSQRTLQFGQMQLQQQQMVQQSMEKSRALKERELALSEQWLQFKMAELAQKQTYTTRQRSYRQATQRAYRAAKTVDPWVRAQAEIAVAEAKARTGAMWKDWEKAREHAREMQLVQKKAQMEVWKEQAEAMAENWLDAQRTARKAWLEQMETLAKDWLDARETAREIVATQAKEAAKTARAVTTEMARMRRELATARLKGLIQMDLEREKTLQNLQQAAREMTVEEQRTARELARAVIEAAKKGEDVRGYLDKLFDILEKARQRKIEVKEVRVRRW